MSENENKCKGIVNLFIKLNNDVVQKGKAISEYINNPNNNVEEDTKPEISNLFSEESDKVLQDIQNDYFFNHCDVVLNDPKITNAIKNFIKYKLNIKKENEK